MTKKEAVSMIMPYATMHAVIGGVLANTAVGDTPLLSALTIHMIISIAKRCGHQVGWKDAGVFALKAFGRVVGLFILDKLLFWLPGVGNAANAVEAFVVTLAIGCSAAAFYTNTPQKEELPYGPLIEP